MKKKITDIVFAEGGAFTGFSCVKEHLPPYLKQFPTAVTFGVELSDAILDEIDGTKPTFTYFNHYRSVNFLIDQIGLKVLIALQRQGFKGYTIAASQSIPTNEVPYSGVFPHKTGAIAAGLGWIGKNGLFIHRDYGPRIRLGTILTNIEQEAIADAPTSKCGSCNKCVEACPAKALTGNNWVYGMEREQLVDPRLCSEYMNRHFKKIGRGSVCGICITVCPYK